MTSRQEKRKHHVEIFLHKVLPSKYITAAIGVNDEGDDYTDFEVRLKTAIWGHNQMTVIMRQEDGEDVQLLIGEDFEHTNEEHFLLHLFLTKFLIEPEEQADRQRYQKTGAYLIMQERQKQLDTPGKSVEDDIAENKNFQLSNAAAKLLFPFNEVTQVISQTPPYKWMPVTWNKLICEGYKERLIIAGALCAAEYDRITHECNKS